MDAIPMVTMAQNAVNWRNTHTHMDRTHSLTHLTFQDTGPFVMIALPAGLSAVISLDSIMSWTVDPQEPLKLYVEHCHMPG